MGKTNNKLRVNSKKFDKAYHDPVYMVKKFDHYIKDVEDALIICYRALDKLKRSVETDWALHRQNMLDSLASDDDDLNNKLKIVRGKNDVKKAKSR